VKNKILLVAHNHHWWIIDGMSVLFAGAGTYHIAEAVAKANEITIDEYQIQQVA